MSKGSGQRKDRVLPDLNRMETRLGAALKEISPRPAFVSTLRTRLDHEPAASERGSHEIQALIVSLASVLGALVLIAAVARGIRALIGLSEALGAGRRAPTNPAQTVS